jgi:hypothetical protein
MKVQLVFHALQGSFDGGHGEDDDGGQPLTQVEVENANGGGWVAALLERHLNDAGLVRSWERFVVGEAGEHHQCTLILAART